MRGTLIALLILLLLILGAVQIVLWSSIPRQIVVAQVQRLLGLRIEAADLTTGWLGNTELSGVTLSLPLADEPLLDAPRLRVRHTPLLWLLITQSFDVRSIEVDRPVLHVRQDSAGAWNVLRAADQVQRATAPPAGSVVKASGAVRLPDVKIIGARLSITQNNGRTLQLEPVDLSGWRDGTLVYHLRAAIADRLTVAGKIAPVDRWEHELQFSGKDLEQLASDFVNGLPKGIAIDGRWNGRLTANGLQGRIELAQLSCGDYSVKGKALVETAGGTVRVEPNDLLLHDAARGDVRLAAGLLLADANSIRATDLALSLFNGQALVSGTWDLPGAAANLHAVWRNLALPDGVTHSGSIDADLSTPWPGQRKLAAQLASTAETDAGHVALACTVQGEGASLNEMKFDVLARDLALTGKRSLSAAGMQAQFHTRGPQLTLDHLTLPGQGELTARGSIDLSTQSWWAWAQGNHLMWEVEDQQTLPLAFNLNLWGDRSAARFHDFYLTIGDAVFFGDGGYEKSNPKPLSLAIALSHAPANDDASESQLLRGNVSGSVQVNGTVAPLNLALSGELLGKNVAIENRALGDLALALSGRANASGFTMQTDELHLLGGAWRLAGAWSAEKGQATRVDIAVDKLPLSEIAPLINAGELSGIASGSMSFQLPSLRLSRARGKGELNAEYVSLGTLAAEHVHAPLALRGGVFSAEPIELKYKTGTARATLNATLLPQVTLKLDVQSTDWPIDLPEHGAGALVSGSAQATYDLPTRAANASATVSAKLHADGRELGAFTADAKLERDQLTLPRIESNAFGGTMRGKATIDTHDLLKTRAGFEWRDIDLAQVATWLPHVETLQGHSRGSLLIEPTDSRHALGPLRLHLLDDVEDGRYRGLALRDSQIVAFIDKDRIVTEGSTFHLGGGSLRVFARVVRQTDALLSLVSAQVDGIDLDQLVHSLSPAAEPMPGQVRGTFSFGGDPREPRKFFGEANLRISQADLINFDPIGALFKQMNVGAAHNEKPQGTVHVQARLDGNNLAITSARIFDRGIEVRGAATVENIWIMPHSPLQGVIVGSAKPLAGIKLPFFADVDQIFSALQSTLSTIVISGTVEQPKVTQGTFADIGTGVRKLLLGDVRAETQSPSGN